LNWLDRATAAGVQGFLHCDELEKLGELATGRDVLEIGAYKGLSAWGMAHTAKHVVSVDTFRATDNGQDQRDQFTTLAEYDRVTAGFTNVTRVPVSSEEAIDLIPGDFDMIFIDAMHTYEDVLADIRRWWPRVRPGGVLAGHDYRHSDFPGVEQAFDEVFGPAPEGTTCVTLRWVQKSVWIPHGPILCTVCGEEKVPNKPHECEEYGDWIAPGPDPKMFETISSRIEKPLGGGE
jgi:SAM-dependent methyltransferase